MSSEGSGIRRSSGYTKLPKLWHTHSAPDLLNISRSDSPRACDRCNKVGVLEFYRLGKSSIILNICCDCATYYKRKESTKGEPLSVRDYTPRM